MAGTVSRVAGGIVVSLIAAGALARTPSPTRYVDPFIGTAGTGHTFPGASLPFGMVAPSPDTADSGWDSASGYQYGAPRIMGFSNSHLSGTGIGELGDVLVQPAAGARWSGTTLDFAAGYDKASERAHPGYYAVTLPDHGVRVELTATPRVALHRYTFDAPGSVQVFVDLAHVIHFRSGPRADRAAVDVDRAGEVRGSLHLRNWTERELAFVLRFDHPIASVTELPAAPGELAPRYLLGFELGAGRTLEARIALSTTDVEGAHRNLAAAANLGFDAARAAAERAWARLLARVRIDAPEGQKRIFYTALYHALLHPSDIADVDGRVRGPDGLVVAARGGHYYSTLSLWDVARAGIPLIALIAPERIDGIMETLLQHHRAQGYLPIWTVWGGETWCMIGNPALPVLAHAVATGFHGFDAHEALTAMVVTSTAPRPTAPAGAQHDWTVYEEFGYLPYDKVDGESVSKTLEYAWGDDAVRRVAQRLGDHATAARFAARGQSYRRLFDPTTQLMRGRSSTGTWRTPFDPVTPTSPLNNPGDYTEADAWQYTVAAGLYDPAGLVALLGGPHAAGEWLDRFMTTHSAVSDRFLGQEGVIGQYAQGNEPSHHVAYLYDWTDRPWRGHVLIRRVARQFYTDAPDGLPGDDDAGQMSAWYVFSTLGFYPVVPSSGDYALGAPLVSAATITLAGGRFLRIEAPGQGGERPWARGLRWNGRRLDPIAVRHTGLVRGGRLELRMLAAPKDVASSP
jgi:predicted alpha-1,2-mannosidase